MNRNTFILLSLLIGSQNAVAKNDSSLKENPLKGKWVSETCTGSLSSNYSSSFVEFIPDENDPSKGIRKKVILHFTDASCQFLANNRAEPYIVSEKYKVIEKSDKDGIIKVDYVQQDKDSDKVLRCMDIIKIVKHDDKPSELYTGVESDGLKTCFDVRNTELSDSIQGYLAPENELEGLFIGNTCFFDIHAPKESAYYKYLNRYGKLDEKGRGTLETFSRVYKDKNCTELVRETLPNTKVRYMPSASYDNNYFKQIKRILFIGGNEIKTEYHVRPKIDSKGNLVGYAEKYIDGKRISETQASTVKVFTKIDE